MQLLIGLRYRVDGILHEYLGAAAFRHSDTNPHVFLNNERRPNTPGQLPLTIVRVSDVDGTVTSVRQKGRK